MSSGPLTSLFFMVSILIRLTISVSVKSCEIKGWGTRPMTCMTYERRSLVPGAIPEICHDSDKKQKLLS